jgi:YVTN family beta-propeller protein
MRPNLVFTLFVIGILSLPAAAQSSILLALNKQENTLAFIDADSMKVLSKIPTGEGPHEVVIDTDGKTAFVANYGAQTPGSSISIVDIASRKELRRVDISPLLRPHGLQFVGGKLYFTAEVNRAIARYDPVTNKIDWLMGTGQNASHMIAVSGDQKKMYTANIGSDSITAFEFNNVPPAPSKIAQVSVGKQPEAIDLSPNGKEVWVGLNVDNAVDVVDAATLKVVGRVAVGQRPYRVEFTPDGSHVLMTIPQTKEIIIYNAATRKETKRMKLESEPLGVAFSPNGKTAYVSVIRPDAVLKIDLDKLSVAGRAETGQAPDGLAYFGR